MNYRTLGRTGIQVSEIGYGTWGFGGDAYGRIDEGDVIELIDWAIQDGITTFDAAPLYGNGRAERLLGGGLADVRSRMTIISKGGQPRSGVYDFSVAALRRSLEDTIDRLWTTYLDVFLLHSPDLDALRATPDVFTFLQNQVEVGRIRTYGIAMRTPEDGIRALDLWDVPVLEVNLNLADHRAIDCGLLDLAQDLGVGIVARTPLCYGYLSGTLTGHETLPGSDHRNTCSIPQRERWVSAISLYGDLIAGRAVTPSQFALLFCLSHPAVSTVVPGMLCRWQIEENVQVSGVRPLSLHEYDEIRSRYAQHVFTEAR